MDLRVSKRVWIETAVGVLVAASTLVTPTADAAPTANIAGMVVVIDPGHNGANDASITRQVPTGRGGTKDCQTSGTTTNTGFPEHTFTWNTAQRVAARLSALGVRTALTRSNDTGLGPCVDARAAMENSVHPNAILSIHADGGPPSGRGFHVNYSAPPLNQVQAGPSVQYARTMRDQLVASGIPPSNYIAQNGLYGRADLAGLNLAEYPSILVECGNMKNAVDSSWMESPEGQEKYADALVRGVAAFLTSQGQAR